MAKIIGNLEPITSKSIDNIPSKLLKQTKSSITESLTIMVNQKLKTGTFPKLLKTSIVLPLYKEGDNLICGTIDLSLFFHQFQKSLKGLF